MEKAEEVWENIQERLAKTNEYEQLYNLMGESTKELFNYTIALHYEIYNPIGHDILAECNKLQDKGCNQVIISFEGHFPKGKKVKSKTQVVLNF